MYITCICYAFFLDTNILCIQYIYIYIYLLSHYLISHIFLSYIIFLNASSTLYTIFQSVAFFSHTPLQLGQVFFACSISGEQRSIVSGRVSAPSGRLIYENKGICCEASSCWSMSVLNRVIDCGVATARKL